MKKTSDLCMNRFIAEEGGNVAIVFGLAAIPIFIFMGAAIDMSRAYHAQARLQIVLDAATLAASNEYATSGSKSAAEAKLAAFVDSGLSQYGMARATNGNANTSTSVRGAQVGPVTLSNATFDEATRSIAPTMSVDVGTTVLGLAGIQAISRQVASSSTVGSTAPQAVEVSIMVDLTGSMGQTAASDTSTKIANLRLAGKDIIDILMPATSDAKASVAIVPFADYVNAGSYAVAATGQPATGSYTNIVNLASTRNGAYSGSYSGYYGSSAASQPSGSQAGTTTGGTTFNNNYCATPTYTQTQTKTDYGWAYVDNYGYGWGRSYSSTCDASHAGYYKWNSDSGYRCQLITAPMGAPVDSRTPGRVDSNSDGYGGYWMQDGQQNGTYVFRYWDDHLDNNRYYLPVTTTGTYAGCESTAQPSGQLITCVTERDNADHYDDDEAPGALNGYVGPYNKSTSGTTNKVNYSSNGKCYVAGRELPAVMPLSKDRASRYNFFDGLNSSSVGGGTPGHLGTAWAWYTLSPKWKTVFTSNQPADYGAARKVVVLMTDGEYNEQYSSRTSASQALDLCTKMKEAGVEVYTVGFGFGQSTTANANGNASERAMDTLTKCSSGSNHYYFPYNGAKLREAFQAIGNSIVAGNGTQTLPSRITQ